MTRPRKTQTARGQAAGAAAIQPLVTLFRVRFTHGYYNANGDRCPDFSILPTPDCATFMQSVGIVVHDQRDGFIVTMPGARRAALANALAKNGAARLGIMLVLNNPAFIGFTALPIETSPMRAIIHGTNLATSGAGPARRFGTDAAIGADALVPVTGPAIALTSPVAGTVTACDMAGKPVASADVGPGTPSTLSFAGLDYGCYSLSGVPARAYRGPAMLAYMPPPPAAAGLLDLLLVQPADGSGDPGAFPVSADGAPIAPVDLTLHFDARETYWRYYVVAGQAARSAEQLAITGGGMIFTKAPALLPNGDKATLFTATRPLALSQQMSVRYSLSGQGHGGNGQRDDIHIARLPNAPTAPVWPAVGHALAGTSEIFVYL